MSFLREEVEDKEHLENMDETGETLSIVLW